MLIPLLFSVIATAAEDKLAYQLLDNLSKSLREQNFSTSFVVVKNNNAEPYHWAHGLSETGEELEVVSVLNGSHRDIIRKGNTVSYLESGVAPYSVASRSVSSPIPEIFSGDIKTLLANYDLVAVGKSRVLGREAYSIRIIAKDEFRFGHRVWLDKESGLLLKFAIMGPNGQLLEQIQFMHIEVDDKLPLALNKIESAELPPVIETPEFYNAATQNWQITWLPAGFEKISANTHRILHTTQATEFKMFSDGLVDVSVYVSLSEDKNRASAIAQEGATIAYNHVLNGIDVSVVGKLPPATAKRIAKSVTFNQHHD